MMMEFHGSRLKEAREARGCSATALAEEIGVTKAAVSQYEHGKQRPRPEVHTRICQVLRVPVSFFAQVPPVTPEAPIFHRSLKSATKRARESAERRYGWVRLIADYVQEFVELPAQNLATFEVSNPARLLDSDVESLANQARAHWKLGKGPIPHIAWFLENRGVIVSRWDIGCDKIDAFSQTDPKTRIRHVVLGAENCVRSRFNAAHELGHLLIHNSLQRHERLLEEHDVIERQAHRFAGAFLLPAESFLSDLTRTTLDGFLALKERWGVSVAAMMHRAKDLGYLHEREYKNLRINYSRRGWSRGEELDDKMEPERPNLLANSLKLILESREQTREQLLARINLHADDISVLTGLDRGLLQEREERPPIPRVRLERTTMADQANNEVVGRVIRFPEQR